MSLKQQYHQKFQKFHPANSKGLAPAEAELNLNLFPHD